MGNTLSCFVDLFRGCKSHKQTSPATITTSNTGDIPFVETEVDKSPSIIIKAVPDSVDCTDAITPVPTDEATSNQSTTTANITNTNTTTTSTTNTTTTTTTTTTYIRQNLPSCPTTFTKPWTFSPCPSPRKLKLPRVRVRVPDSNASTAAKITALPVVFPAMDHIDNDAAPATSPSRISACLMQVDSKNKYIKQEQMGEIHIDRETACGRQRRWKTARTVVHRRGVDVAEWEAGALVDKESEKEEVEEGKKKAVLGEKRIRYVNEDLRGNGEGVRKLRSESEQVAWVEKGKSGKDEGLETRWDALTDEDRALMARVMLACEGEEGKIEMEAGCWVQQIF